MNLRVVLPWGLAIASLGIVAAAGDRAIESGESLEAVTREAMSTSVLIGDGPSAHAVIFFDYGCTFCKKLDRWTRALQQKNSTLTIGYRFIPGSLLLGGDRLAAIAAICAAEQGQFPVMHDALSTETSHAGHRSEWFVSLALGIGIDDANSFRNCMLGDLAPRQLAEDRALANRMRLPGTPAIVSANGVTYGLPRNPSSLEEILAKPF